MEAWSARDIKADVDWKRKADENLKAADVILLCVSADYVASDYCWDVRGWRWSCSAGGSARRA